MLPNDPQIHSCALHCPNVGVEVNITNKALFSFSMSKIGDEALYEICFLSACHTLFGGSSLFHYGVDCKGHDQGQALTFASLLLPYEYNLREGCEKILFMSETRV